MDSMGIHIYRSSSSSFCKTKKKLRTGKDSVFQKMEIVLMNPKRAKWVVEQVDVHNGRRVFHVMI